MFNLGWSDAAILAMAAYVSLMTLVRLLRHRRDEVVARYQALVTAARKRKKAAERQRKRQQGKRPSKKQQSEHAGKS